MFELLCGEVDVRRHYDPKVLPKPEWVIKGLPVLGVITISGL